MQQVIGNFIHVLRQHGLPISPAETLDALKATQLIDISNVQQTKNTLAITLAKNLQHRSLLESLFDQFFQLNIVDDDSSSNETSTEDQQQKSDSPPPLSLDSNQLQGAEESIKSPLGQQLLNNEQANIQLAINSAGGEAGVSEMEIFTQKSRMTYKIMQAIGDDKLGQELAELTSDNTQIALIEALQQKRQALLEHVKDYVEQQYLLFSQEKGNQLRENQLQSIRLTNVDRHYYQLMLKLVQKAAKQLASLHSRRRKTTKRGLLDVRKTIAANAAYDGFLFHTKWKSTLIDRPKLMVLCDVSGSVSRVARFLLLFLYSLQDVLPNVRSFVFSSQLAEVTKCFSENSIEIAITDIMDQWANNPTDYGIALADFRQIALNDIDNKTTVIMLGDARNNNSDGNTEIWEQVYRRSNRVLWLNPERPNSWNTGDSIMHEYAAYCSRVESCNSLRDLTRILGSLLKNT